MVPSVQGFIGMLVLIGIAVVVAGVYTVHQRRRGTPGPQRAGVGTPPRPRPAPPSPAPAEMLGHDAPLAVRARQERHACGPTAAVELVRAETGMRLAEAERFVADLD